jgi:hypothetical protein
MDVRLFHIIAAMHPPHLAPKPTGRCRPGEVIAPPEIGSVEFLTAAVNSRCGAGVTTETGEDIPMIQQGTAHLLFRCILSGTSTRQMPFSFWR